ncbi:MAG: hypothetical protein HRT35_33705, partial [Algicola sp.]|nr:hypothetical protein [Algicola sp.]
MNALACPFSDTEIKQELNNILTSRFFAKAQRLREFLVYIVENALNGTADRLKEYTIGVEVYGREVTFDPQTDTVVRVTASRVRNKLKQYYDSLVCHTALHIELPARAYAPAFV